MSLKDKKSGLNVLQDFGALIALIVLVVGISIFSPEFRQPTNLLSLLRQSSINGLIAFGMTGVILTGGIDRSVGSVLALSTAFCSCRYARGTRHRRYIWRCQRISRYKGPSAAVYRYIDNYDCIPRRYYDIYRG